MNKSTIHHPKEQTFKMKLFTIIILTLLVIKSKCDASGLPMVNKCCSTNHIVGQRSGVTKLCFDAPKDRNLSLSDIPIFKFKGEMEMSDKMFDDIFKIVPNKFETDEVFHTVSNNTAILRSFNVYLTEDGFPYLELPHSYNRWTKVDPDNFCVDFYTNKYGITKPGFWVRLIPQTQDSNDGYLTTAMIVSCCFLMVVLIVYALLPELRNLCGLILMAYVASLLMALLQLAIIRQIDFGVDACYRLTLSIYYFFLASFCWMNVMSYDIWWTFRGYAKARPIHRRGKPFKYMMYSIYAWGLPLAMTLMLNWVNTTNAFDKMPWFITPNLPGVGCFIEGGEKLLYLYMPMLILICANWLFYLMTAFNIWRLSRGTAVLDSAAAGTPAAHRNHRQRFLVYLKLSVVMGLNWILEVVSFLVPEFRLWFISDFYNILIGVSIFLIFVCKRKILKKLEKQLSQYTHKWYPNNSTRSNSTSESSQETQALQVCVSPKGPAYIQNNF